MIKNKNNCLIEVWGVFTYRAFRIIWMLEEFNLPYKIYPIRSRTGETQTKEYLRMNPKGKIPLFRYDNFFINESIAAMNFIENNFRKPATFYSTKDPIYKAKIDEWTYFCAMELDCLSIYTIRKHEKKSKNGLEKIYGSAPKAVKTARQHFDKMLNACANNIPKDSYLMGKKVSCADVMFMSCLQVANFFGIEIKNKKVSKYYEIIKTKPAYIRAMKATYENNSF